MEDVLTDLNWAACYDDAGPANEGSAARFHLKKQKTHNAPTYNRQRKHGSATLCHIKCTSVVENNVS